MSWIKKQMNKLEDPNRPLLGPNVKWLNLWGLILPKDKVKRNIYLVIHHLIFIFIVTEYIDLWVTRSDMKRFLLSMKYAMLSTINFIKVFTFLLWQNKWISIIDYVTEEDLKRRTSEDEVSQEIIRKYTKFCRTVSHLYFYLTFATVGAAVLQPVLQYLVSSADDKSSIKNVEVVNSWLPLDKSTWTGYLITISYQILVTFYLGGWVSSFDTNAFTVMNFFQGELELLRLDCRHLFGSEEMPKTKIEARTKLSEIHERHNKLINFDIPFVMATAAFFLDTVFSLRSAMVTKFYSDYYYFHLSIFNTALLAFQDENSTYSRLFDTCLSPIMLLYVIVCSIMLCATAYQINIETSAIQKFLTTEFLIFGISQLFMFCWHSNEVYYVSMDLTLGPYESIWWTRDVSEIRDINILIDQFNRPIVFSAGPFTNITVATFISILKGAYSYYTLLSQSQED